MGIDQTRRITFEEAADFYNETRPEYPDEVVEDGTEFQESQNSN